MRRLLPLCLLFLTSCAWIARQHEQDEGKYAFSYAPADVLKDTCGILGNEPAAGPGRQSLPGGNLIIAGDTAYMDYDLYGIRLAGRFQRVNEAFFLDGTANKVTVDINGSSCVVDSATLHMESETLSPTQFKGVLTLRYDTVQPATCACELEVNFQADRQ